MRCNCMNPEPAAAEGSEGKPAPKCPLPPTPPLGPPPHSPPHPGLPVRPGALLPGAPRPSQPRQALRPWLLRVLRPPAPLHHLRPPGCVPHARQRRAAAWPPGTKPPRLPSQQPGWPAWHLRGTPLRGLPPANPLPALLPPPGPQAALTASLALRARRVVWATSAAWRPAARAGASTMAAAASAASTCPAVGAAGAAPAATPATTAWSASAAGAGSTLQTTALGGRRQNSPLFHKARRPWWCLPPLQACLCRNACLTCVCNPQVRGP